MPGAFEHAADVARRVRVCDPEPEDRLHRSESNRLVRVIEQTEDERAAPLLPERGQHADRREGEGRDVRARIGGDDCPEGLVRDRRDCSEEVLCDLERVRCAETVGEALEPASQDREGRAADRAERGDEASAGGGRLHADACRIQGVGPERAGRDEEPLAGGRPAREDVLRDRRQRGRVTQGVKDALGRLGPRAALGGEMVERAREAPERFDLEGRDELGKGALEREHQLGEGAWIGRPHHLAEERRGIVRERKACAGRGRVGERARARDEPSLPLRPARRSAPGSGWTRGEGARKAAGTRKSGGGDTLGMPCGVIRGCDGGMLTRRNCPESETGATSRRSRSAARRSRIDG